MGAISVPTGQDPADAERLKAATHTTLETFALSRVILVFFGIIVFTFVLLELPWTAFRLRHYGAIGWAFSSKPKPNHKQSSTRSNHDAADNTYTYAAALPRRIGRLPHFIPNYVVPKVNLSLPQVSMLLLAFVLITIASFANSNWLTDSSRSGYVAITLVPCVIALGNKVFGVGTFLAVGYASVNWAHRWLGRLLFLVATVHAIAYFTIFISTHSFKTEMSKPSNVLATISYTGFCLIFLGSIGPVRRWHWHIFKICHHFGIFLFIIGLNYHSAILRPWVVFSVLAIGISAIFRVLTSRLHIAYLVALPSSKSTIVHMPSVRSGWLPGQNVRIRVLTGGMGLNAIWESHPFTLMSVPSVAEGSDGDGAKLVVKAAGDWTNKLFAVAIKKDGDVEGPRRSRGYPVAVLIEGPYGGCNLVYSAYGSVLLAAGGSGVSYVLGTANGIVADCKAGRAVTRNLYVVWAVRDRAAINDILPEFEELLEKGKYLPQLRIVITLHFTSASRGLVVRPFSAMPTASMLLHRRPDGTKLSGLSNSFMANNSTAALLAPGNSSAVDLPIDPKTGLVAPPQFIIGGNEDARSETLCGSIDGPYDGIDLNNEKNPFSDFYAPAPPSPTTKPSWRSPKIEIASSPPIELKPGRPQYNHTLQHIIESEQARARSFAERFRMANAGYDDSGIGRIAVGACGPSAMVASLRSLCYGADGVEFHAEEFRL